jgi:hydroxymethylbilane synthase
MDGQPQIRLGTRASQLALWQSHWVRQQLETFGVDVELIQIRTDGDDQSQPLAQIGGQGLFTKRLQVALLNHEIDLAVHSLKDLPTQDEPGLKIAAIPPRENSVDVLVSNRATSLDSLPAGAVVGTGSVRRSAQLLHLRNDLRIENIRGNVDTRLRKLDEGLFDAIVLAAAGLLRLGMKERIAYFFSPRELMPAVGQGALGLETRADDEATIRVVKQLNHLPSYFSAMAERAMLRKLFAGCLSPVGADSTVSGEELTLHGIVLSRDGRKKVTSSRTGNLTQAAGIGVAVAESLIENGADQFLRNDST